MPGVIGAIDGTHVAILCPKKEVEHVYYNRKQYHSLNVLLVSLFEQTFSELSLIYGMLKVCDLDLRILYVNARYGGSTHDAFIWRTSSLQRHMNEIYRNGSRSWLIGK